MADGPFFPGGGFGTSRGGVLGLGPLPNVFGDMATANRAAAEALRDAQAADAEWLGEYNGSLSFWIRLVWNGGVAEQRRNAAQSGWEDVTNIIRGVMGTVGAQGRFVISIFHTAVAVPAAPVGGSYTVETGVLVLPADWTALPSRPAAGENVYESQAVINPEVDMGAVVPAWSEPVEATAEVARLAANAAQAAEVAAEAAQTGAVAARRLAEDARDEAGAARNAAQGSQVQSGQSADAAGVSAIAAMAARDGAEAARDSAVAHAGVGTALADAVVDNVEEGIDVTYENGKLNFRVTGGGVAPVSDHTRYAALTLAQDAVAADFVDADYSASSETEDILLPNFNENRYLTFTRRADLPDPTFIGVKNGQNQIGGFIKLALRVDLPPGAGAVEQALWQHVDSNGEPEIVFSVLSSTIWTIR